MYNGTRLLPRQFSSTEKKSQSNPNVTAERNLSISVKQIKKNKLESPK
jgi:hypothetical protein